MQLCGFGLIFAALGSDSVFHNECGLGAGYPRDKVPLEPDADSVQREIPFHSGKGRVPCYLEESGYRH